MPPQCTFKYSFASLSKVYKLLQQTIQSGCPCPTRIADNINRVFTENLTRIINAKGPYIEDCSNKSTRHEAVTKKDISLPVNAATTNAFILMVKNTKDNGGVSFTCDTMGEGEVFYQSSGKQG
jgi:hypothetical protein